jgi:hypothetical protein
VPGSSSQFAATAAAFAAAREAWDRQMQELSEHIKRRYHFKLDPDHAELPDPQCLHCHLWAPQYML